MNELNNTLAELSEQLAVAVKAILINKGVKMNADILKSVEFKGSNDMVQFMVNDYLEALSTGRKAGVRKIPIKYLLEFIKKNIIQGKQSQSPNSVAYAIQTSIYKQGIIGKNFMDTIMQTVESLSADKIESDTEEIILDNLSDLKIN